MKQPQYQPLPVANQVMIIYAVTNGFLDELPLDKVHDYERRLLDYLRHNTGVLEKIADTGLLEKETEEELRAAVKEFTRGYLVAEGVAADGEGEVEVETEVAKEQIVRAKRG